MRAVVCHAFGPIESLKVEEFPNPAMIAGGVRIAVHAAGISFADGLVVEGSYQRKPPFPFVPGMPVAGVVTEVADGVARVKVGDRVMAALDNGAWAEEAVIGEAQVFPIPDAMSFGDAIAFPFTYGTSYGALTWCARLVAGETLLVHGAAGGVGLAAVEIGKAMGAKVIATAGGEAKCDLVRAHGADVVIDHRTGPFRDKVLEATGGRGADVVYDPVGGPTFDQSLRCIAPEGRILPIGFAGGTIQSIPANLLLVKNVTVCGLNLGYYYGWSPDDVRYEYEDRMRAGMAQMFAWFEAGKLKPTVHKTYPLEGFREAMADVLGRAAIGRVVVAFD